MNEAKLSDNLDRQGGGFAGGIAADSFVMPEESIGACGRRLVWLPNSAGRLALAVEPKSPAAAPLCSRCRSKCPGHELFAEHTPVPEIS